MSTKKSGAQSSTKAGLASNKKDSKSKGKGKGDEGSETVWVEPANFSEEESDDPEYEVEEIVGKKVKRGVIYYQVKWKGFPLEDATWEPEDNLDHAPLKIRAYENQLLASESDSTAKDKKGKPETPAPTSKASGKDSDTTGKKLSALASNNEGEGLLGKRSRDSLDKEKSKTQEQEDKKKNKNSAENKKGTSNGAQKEEKNEKGTKKVDRRTLEEKSKLEEEAKKDEKPVEKGKKTDSKTAMEEEKESDTKQKKMEEEKPEPTSTKSKKGDQAASTSQQDAQPASTDKAAGEAGPGNESASGNRANKDEGMSLSRIMQDEKLMEGSETEEPSINDHRESETPEPTSKGKKGKQKEQGEYGSLEKDTPLRVIGIRPVKEENDLEVMVSWKPRETGVKPYNSKIMRLALLKKGHWMPLIEFYESKMKLESAPNFDPSLLPRCNNP